MSKLLDLYCGAGGAGMGYHRAGFDVAGVDIKPSPRYPFRFIMRAAGWQSMGQGSYMYTHQNGRSVQINLFALDISGERPCEVWHAYAAANEVPAPF